MTNPEDMKLADWLVNHETIGQFRKWIAKPIAQQALVVLRNENPRIEPVTNDTTESNMIRKLGQIEGYEYALFIIRAMCQLNPEQQQLEAEFPDPDAASNQNE